MTDQCPKQSTCATYREVQSRGPFAAERSDGLAVALLYMLVGAAVGFVAALWLVKGGAL